ncbi:MAG TPA: SWIM zinc finger family protein [Planctomycetaceae bacterium]|nr:SWIM zinc finger family protein [Planctomycetaceae bacterium]
MWYSYKPYVSVAKRRDQAAREITQRRKKGQTLSPITIEGRNITTTFWGQAWCNHLESYSDYANRLPRGRSYVRNGFVIDLQIEKGKINALVSGSEVYKIEINIAALPTPAWQSLKQKSAGQIGSLVELLQGKLSKSVMELVVDREKGLFPKPKEIKMRCSCPDYVGMCKHLAAVLYGIGSRFDTSPELLFLLRGVDHTELIEQAIPAAPAESTGNVPTLASEDLGAIFGIELGDEPQPVAATPVKKGMKKAVKKASATTKGAAAKKASAAKTGTTAKKSPAAKKGAARKTTAVKQTKPAVARKKK